MEKVNFNDRNTKGKVNFIATLFIKLLFRKGTLALDYFYLGL